MKNHEPILEVFFLTGRLTYRHAWDATLRRAPFLRAAVGCLALAASGLVPVLAYADVRAIESAIEQDVISLFAGRLDNRLFLVSVRVEDAPSEGEKKQTPSGLPFASFRIDTGLWRKVLGDEATTGPSLPMRFKIVLRFDARVAESQKQGLTATLRERYRIDDISRLLIVQTATLFADEAPLADRDADREKLKIETERAQALLEAERIKIDLARKDLEQKQTESRAEERIKAEIALRSQDVEKLESEIKRQKEQLNAERKPKRLVDTLKDFENLVISVCLFLGLLGAFTVGGLAFRGGMTSMSNGLRSIGSSVADALRSHNRTDELGLAVDRDAAKEATTAGGDPELAESARHDWSAGRPDYEAFVAQVQEKIEVLIKEHDYSFVQHFADLLSDVDKLPLCAAVLLALPQETARALLRDLPADEVRTLQGFLRRPGALARAKALRKPALQEFFGQIAMDEFIDSPLSELKELGWLTRMSSQTMASFVANLPERDRAPFLACLSTTRTRLLFKAAADAATKEAIIVAMAGLGEVTESKIRSLINRLKSRDEASQAATTPIVNRSHYVAQVADSLDPDDQELLYATLGQDAAMLRELERVFVPLSVIARFPTATIATIFATRDARQIATLLFRVKENTREGILVALPPIKAESARSELAVLEADPVAGARAVQAAKIAQRELGAKVAEMVRGGGLTLEQSNRLRTPRVVGGRGGTNAA